MPELLTDSRIKQLPAPAKGLIIYRDSKEKGLGVRVLPTGTRSFVLVYTIAGRRRVFTIGQTDGWQVTAARERARLLKNKIRYEGHDPAEVLRTEREAPTVADLCDEFTKNYLPKLRPATQSDYARVIRTDILPKLGARKVAQVGHNDIQARVLEITKRAPGSGNLFLALSSRLFNLAIKWGWTTKNPVKGVERFKAPPRNRYLSKAEIAALMKALDEYEDQHIADVFRLLLYTGARRGETQSATWDQFDLKEGIWTKPASSTKQKRTHRVPLAAPARALLIQRRARADAALLKLEKEIANVSPTERAALQERAQWVRTYVFPARKHYSETGHVVSIKKAWRTVCKSAGITKARIHDLRHSAASVLASQGVSLYIVGQLLGHSNASTTQRYAHLFDEDQRAAVERLGQAITAKPKKFAAKGKR